MKLYQNTNIKFPHTYHEWKETRPENYNGNMKVSLSVYLSNFGIKKVMEVTNYHIQYHESDVRTMLVEETNKLLKNYTAQVCAMTCKLSNPVGIKISPDLLIYAPLQPEWFTLKTLTQNSVVVLDNAEPRELSWGQITDMRIYDKPNEITTTLARFW